MKKISYKKHFSLKVVLSCLILFNIVGCANINVGSSTYVREANDKVLASNEDIGTLKVFVKNNKELKSLGNALRAKNNSSLRVKLDLINSDITNLGTTFKDCKCLTSIRLPNSIKLIEENAFNGCENLTEFVVPEGVKTIDSYSFYNCKNLTKVTFISENCTSIGYGAFMECNSLKSVTIPSSVKKLGTNAFVACPDLFFVVRGENKWKVGDTANNVELTDNNKLNWGEELTRN